MFCRFGSSCFLLLVASSSIVGAILLSSCNSGEMSSHSCCPENSHGYLAPTYSTKGTTNSLPPSNYEYYAVGSPSDKKAIVIIPDIYGWNGYQFLNQIIGTIFLFGNFCRGRTRNVADYFADLGYYVVVPKLLQPAMEGATDDDGFLYEPFHLNS